MTVSHTPSPARSDLTTGTRPAAATTTRPFLRHGRLLSIGAVMWAVCFPLFGNDPDTTLGLLAFGIGSGTFQLGLLALLRVLWRTRALGTGRIARGVLRVEAVVVCLAILSTIVDAVQLSDLDQVGWLLLDLNWPLSMMGMFFIGIRIAIAGRWSGASRFWPMVAESWAVVVIPTINVFGPTVAGWVSFAHLLVGYATLGVIVSRKQG